MEVTLAKSAGFCFGVKRAVEEVERQLKEGVRPIYTYGPIIHNEQVVQDLSDRGVRVIGSEEELSGIREGTIVIRSHGVPERVQRKMEETGVSVVDATCPFVKKIHKIAKKAGEEGRTLVIAGDPEHPEVQGIVGWTAGKYLILRGVEDISRLAREISPEEKLTVVAQTTFNKHKYEEIIEKIHKMGYDANCINTVCNATDERQTEARQIARKVDAMIVVGGKHSSNTQKLYQICAEECKNTYFAETLVDLDITPFQSISHVGITAGASTPNRIIEEVVDYVRRTEL